MSEKWSFMSVDNDGRIGPASAKLIEMFAPTRIRRPCNSSLLESRLGTQERLIEYPKSV